MLCLIGRCSQLPDLRQVDMRHVQRELCVSCRAWGPSGIQTRCFKGQWTDWGAGCANFFLETQNFHFYQYHLFFRRLYKVRATRKELKHLIRLIKHISQSLDQIIWIFPLEWIYLIKGNAHLLVAPTKCFRFFPSTVYGPKLKISQFNRSANILHSFYKGNAGFSDAGSDCTEGWAFMASI